MSESKYVSHAVPTKISATSRCAVKVKDNYYTIEVSEERSINEANGINMDKEYELLFEEVNSVVDKQCEDIIKTFK
jgi:hypothetical protein